MRINHNSILFRREKVKFNWTNFEFSNRMSNLDFKLGFVGGGFQHSKGIDHVLLVASVRSVHQNVIFEEL